tara:strand:- start:17342 stop:18376 length:1035 start_codon:yes stop_codon:yes gene_type:complete
MTHSDNFHLKKLNNRLRAILPQNQNVAVTIAGILDISKEGAYRRLRGTTSFTLDELMVLRKKIGLSIDELLSGTENVSFSFKPLYNAPLELDKYFEDVHVRFKKIGDIQHSMTYNVCEDLPFFRQFGYTALASFKLFYWKHSILLEPEYTMLKFNTEAIPADTLALAQTMHTLYCDIPSTEVWTELTLKNTLRQIEYFQDCGFFETEESLRLVYMDLIQLLDDLMSDARQASKKNEATAGQVDFHLYICELSLNNNSVYLETHEPKFLATGFNGFNSIQTMDTRLLNEYKQWLSAMLSKSTKISGQAERTRREFYRASMALITQSAKGRLAEPLQTNANQNMSS